MSKPLTHEQVTVTRDLQRKCAEDTIRTIERTLSLAGGHAESTFIAMGGVVAAAGMVMALISKDQKVFNDMTGAEMHDNALLAMLFAWHTERYKGQPGGLAEIFPQSIRQWEQITGKTFDSSWLVEALSCLVKK